MSGAYCTEQKLKGLHCHSLFAPSISTLLIEYQRILHHIFGPKAGTTLVRLGGGIDIFMNSSKELVKHVEFPHPCIKLINCYMEAQNNSYGCLGLHVGVLCSSLFKNLNEIVSDTTIPLSRLAVKEASSLLMARIIAYLESNPENLVSKLDLANLDQMLAVVATSLGSKNLGLHAEEKHHLQVTIIEAFIASIPSADAKDLDNFGDVIVTLVDGRPSTEAQVFDGLLYREPNPNTQLIMSLQQKIKSRHPNFAGTQLVRPTNKRPSVNVRQNQQFQNKNNSEITHNIVPSNNALGNPRSPRLSNTLHFSKYSRHISDIENDAHIIPKNIQEPSEIQVVLFNVPLQFEESESECINLEGRSDKGRQYDVLVVAKLRQLIKSYGVDIIACQKVVSDFIKLSLQRDGVLVLERLGTALTNSFQQLTGCVAISDIAGLPTLLQKEEEASSIQQTDEANVLGSGGKLCNGFVGTLTNISVVEVGGKSYLQLENRRQKSELRKVAGQERKDQDVAVKTSPVVTFLLPSLSSVTSESLKAVVEECLQVLRHISVHPLVSAAGGCFEAALTHWITNHATAPSGGEDVAADTTIDQLLNEDDLLGLEPDDEFAGWRLNLVARQFARSFASIGLLLSGGRYASAFDFTIDSGTSHLFNEPHTGPASFFSSKKSSTKRHSSIDKCSCRSTVPTQSANSSKHQFVDVYGFFETPSHLNLNNCFPKTILHAESTDDFNDEKVSEERSSEERSSEERSSEERSSEENTPEKNASEENASEENASEENTSEENTSEENVSEEYASEGEKCDSRLSSHKFEVTANTLVESYYAKLHAIRLAFEGVEQLLGVDYCIFDR